MRTRATLLFARPSITALLLAILLLFAAILISGCAAPQAPASQPQGPSNGAGSYNDHNNTNISNDNLNISDNTIIPNNNNANNSLSNAASGDGAAVAADYALAEGDSVTLPGNVTLRFAASGANATFLLSGQEIVLAPGANASALNFTLRLDALARGALKEARRGAADFSLSTDRGSVRDTITEGETRQYILNASDATLNVTLSFVGRDAGGQDVAQFSVDGVTLRPLAQQQDAFLGDGYLFVHYLYPARDGTIAVDVANVTVTRNK